MQRMSAPMFVEQSTGLNDNLNRVEAPVSFTMKDLPGETIEIVHSLAKWKRIALKKYGFGLHEGLYTNMNAIRKDEGLDNFHSIYVDQWDWEKVIAKEERTEATLKATVRQVFKVIKHMEHEVWYNFPQAVYHLPDEIHFVTTQELEDRWPELSPMEREDKIAEELGCVFVMKIGDKLQRSGEPLQTKLEVSSKGIRVDERAMKEQLEKGSRYRPGRIAVPPRPLGRQDAVHDWGRDRPVPAVHAFARQSPRRGSPSLDLARRDERSLR